MLVIDLVVKWYKIRIFSGNINHNCLFETASKIEVFEPERIALILYPLKDCFQIRDTGEYRGYETDRTDTCFVYLVFPGITDFEAIFERVKDQCDLFWLENLNLRGGFKKTIMDYIAGKYPDLVPLYDEIYNKHNRSYFEALEVKAAEMAKKYDCAFVDNEMPYGRVPHRSTRSRFPCADCAACCFPHTIPS